MQISRGAWNEWKGLVVAFLLAATPVHGQDGTQGYGTLGFWRPGIFNVSVGGEEVHGLGRIGAEVGIGAEIGVVAFSGESFLLLSANAGFHFVADRNSQPVVPFVTAGGSLVGDGRGGAALWNIGAGATIWVRPRLGVRVEWRRYILPGEGHFQLFRVGVAFRRTPQGP